MDDHIHWPDRACHGRATVIENDFLARDTWRLRLECPELARRVVPGQFVMIRMPGTDDPLLGRPLALYDTVLDDSGDPLGIDIVHLVVGKMTGRLARLRQLDTVELWGPLGNGFPVRPCEHLVMVAGGIGQTPFVALAREYLGLREFGETPRNVPKSAKVTLCYGARTRDYLAGVSDFTSLGVDVRLATDDGSHGHAGLVTELLEQVLDESTAGVRVVCCGPEKMMQAVAELTARRQVPCEVSLETPMACGIGICFSCVAKVRTEDAAGEGWDYRRTCVEGPVFDAGQIVF